MPRKIGIISSVTLTVVMGGWLLSIGARGFGPGTADADPAPTAAVASVDAPTSNGVSSATDVADDSTYEQIADDRDDQAEQQDADSEDGDDDATTQGHDDDEHEHEHEGPEHEADN